MLKRYYIFCVFLFFCLLTSRSKLSAEAFDVYWNVPSLQCFYDYRLPVFPSGFGIIFNTYFWFFGDKIGLLYRPGRFPHFYGNSPRNKGIPQKANKRRHVEDFYYSVNRNFIPEFAGLAILDFEDYEPVYKNSRLIYQSESQKLVAEQNPTLTLGQIEELAELSFNESSKYLFKILLEQGARLRPGAKWGYFGYPKCGNLSPNDADCNPDDMANSETNQWLFDLSGAFYPSALIKDTNWERSSIHLQVKSMYAEAKRIRSLTLNGDGKPILPMFSFRYQDTGELLSVEDIFAVMGTLKDEGADGVVIWEQGKDLNSYGKCLEFRDYLTDSLGPIAEYFLGN